MKPIQSLDDVIERLQYKADNIKAKLEPEYFAECVDYLQKLQIHTAWIPCSERLPQTLKKVEITARSWIDNKPVTGCDFAYYRNGKWYWNGNRDEVTVEVIAWREYEKSEPYVPEMEGDI